MVPPASHRVSRVRRYSGTGRQSLRVRVRGSNPVSPAFPGRSAQSCTKLGSGEGETWQNVNVSTQYGGIEGFQPGSTFKPFVIGAALEQGVLTSTSFDAPQTMQFRGAKFKNCEGTFTFNGNWEPKNYDKAYGVIDMLKATQNSVNTYFVIEDRKSVV